MFFQQRFAVGCVLKFFPQGFYVGHDDSRSEQVDTLEKTNSTLHKQGQSHNHRQWSLQTSPRSVLELSYFQGGGFDVDDDDQFGQWASNSQSRMTPSAGFGKVRKVNPLSDKLPLTSMSFRRAALAFSAQLCLHFLCFTRCFPACSPF